VASSFSWVMVFTFCAAGCSNAATSDVGSNANAGGKSGSNVISNVTSQKLNSCSSASGTSNSKDTSTASGALTIQDASTPDGAIVDVTQLGSMECVSWRINGGVMHLEIDNLAKACASSYSMQAVNQASSLVVNLTSSQDAPPCVNKCYYVLSADVNVGDTPSQIEVTAGQTATLGTVALGTSEGSACRYYWWVNTPATTVGRVRGAFGAPFNTIQCPTGTIYSEGLAQNAGGATAGNYYLPQCTTDGDCLTMESCEAGLCHLKTSSLWKATETFSDQ